MSCKWFLARTQPRRENTAKGHIERQGAEVYLPVLTELGRLRPLFPSYLFVHYCQLSYSWIENTIGVSKLVRMGPDPVTVSQKLIDHIQRVEYDLSLAPEDRSLKVGDRCHALNGPFATIDAICEGMLPSKRISLLMNIFGRPTRVECDLKDVVAAAA